MPKIAISYRRSDAPADAGRIFDRLTARYGQGSVFMDIDTIPLGVDFRDYIDSALHGTDIVLALIGPRWLGRRGGRTRIQDVTDPVRIEIEAAMRLGKIIVPVLVANGVMPSPSDLPESIVKLAFLNGAEVESGKDFHVNLDRLIRFIDALPATAPIEGTAAKEAEHDAASIADEPPAQAEPTGEPSVATVLAESPARTEPAGEPSATKDPGQEGRLVLSSVDGDTSLPVIGDAIDEPAAPIISSHELGPAQPSPDVPPDEGESTVPVRQRGEEAPPTASPASPSKYAGRITAAWWVSMVRGFAIILYSGARLLDHDDTLRLVALDSWFLVEFAALIVMAIAVRGRTTATAYFVAAAIFFLGFVVSDLNFGTALLILDGFLALRALAEMAAGRILMQYVRAERLRVYFAAILLTNEAVDALYTVSPGMFPRVYYYVGIASAIVLIVLARRLRKEELMAKTVATAA